jgi:hypothetical protein
MKMLITTILRSALGWAKGNPLLAVALIVFAVLGTRLTLAERRIGHLEHEADTLTLTILNDRAAADTTIAFYQDGALIHQRLTQQRTIERDSIDRALGLQTKALLRITAQVRKLDARIIGDTVKVDTAGVRSFRFSFRDAPFTTEGLITVPPPPSRGSMELGISLDPAPFTARLSCVTVPGRLNAAKIVLVGPAWLNFTLGTITQHPKICNPGFGVPSGERSRGHSTIFTTLLGTAAGAVAGWVIDDAPLKGAGLGLGTAILFRLVF